MVHVLVRSSKVVAVARIGSSCRILKRLHVTRYEGLIDLMRGKERITHNTTNQLAMLKELQVDPQ